MLDPSAMTVGKFLLPGLHLSEWQMAKLEAQTMQCCCGESYTKSSHGVLHLVHVPFPTPCLSSATSQAPQSRPRWDPRRPWFVSQPQLRLPCLVGWWWNVRGLLWGMRWLMGEGLLSAFWSTQTKQWSGCCAWMLLLLLLPFLSRKRAWHQKDESPHNQKSLEICKVEICRNATPSRESQSQTEDYVWFFCKLKKMSCLIRRRKAQ